MYVCMDFDYFMKIIKYKGKKCNYTNFRIPQYFYPPIRY